MTSDHTIHIDSLHRFMGALAPHLAELQALASGLAERPEAFSAATASRLLSMAELLSALQSEFHALLALEARQHPVQPRWVDLRPLCLEIAELLGELAQQQDLQLHVAVPPDLQAWADPSLCGHIVRRLVVNALSYTSDGGRVCVSVKPSTDGQVILRVSDSGPGLSRAQRQALFAPFERLGKELCAHDGIGMGLAMAQGMARIMGARLQVRSRPGRGSIFRLTLPKP